MVHAFAIVLPSEANMMVLILCVRFGLDGQAVFGTAGAVVPSIHCTMTWYASRVVGSDLAEHTKYSRRCQFARLFSFQGGAPMMPFFRSKMLRLDHRATNRRAGMRDRESEHRC